MEDERSRRSWLILALGNDASVLQRITWSGAVSAFIPDMVEKLADYGEITPGKPALWALLECVRSHSGIDSQQRIDKLRPRIDLGWHSELVKDTSDIDALVENVRSRLHDDIQSWHGTMPLWGVDRCSPVFDDEFKVVAIHHSGGMLVEPGTQQRYLRNAGTSMIAVLKDMQANAPEIYARLQG